MAPPTTRDSAVSPFFHGCPAFPHRHFPPQFPPSHPLDQSLRSQQQPLPWDCSVVPKLQFPAAAPSRGPASLSGICMAAARTVWFSFHLGCHRSAVSLSALNVSPLTQRVAPMWGSDPASVPPPAEGRSCPTNTPVCAPSTHILWVLHGSVYSFLLVRYSCLLSAGVLHAFSVSEGVFLMYPWREMCSASTYSSAILFSSHTVFFLIKNLVKHYFIESSQCGYT